MGSYRIDGDGKHSMGDVVNNTVITMYGAR